MVKLAAAIGGGILAVLLVVVLAMADARLFDEDAEFSPLYEATLKDAYSRFEASDRQVPAKAPDVAGRYDAPQQPVDHQGDGDDQDDAQRPIDQPGRGVGEELVVGPLVDPAACRRRRRPAGVVDGLKCRHGQRVILEERLLEEVDHGRP